ncbi:hypothetical protein [Flavobacterium faecale]|uniref:hypothetical protein n=1 Tax=Flavobacterium faecale TaxID=1355330 RepID=UPI003AAD4985
MQNRLIVDIINKYVIEGLKNKYTGFKIENRILRNNSYSITSPFICIIASTTLAYSNNIGLDYLYINVHNTLDEILSLNVNTIQNPHFIFIPIVNNEDFTSIVKDIKLKYQKHGFNEEPFYNSL